MNPVEYYWKNRIKQQPLDVQKKLQALKEKGHLTDELIFIQKKRPRLKIGDVFVVQPKENIYFYGVIINRVSTPLYTNKNVICIFQNKTHTSNMNDFELDFDALLLPPLWCNAEPWTSGYFLNVGHIDMESISVPTYGFYHSPMQKILSEMGQTLTIAPKLLGSATMNGIGAIAFQITQELIINPELLDGNCKSKKQDFCEKMPQVLRKYEHPLYTGECDL